MKRSRAWRRAKNYSKALRKYRLAQELYGPGGWHMPFHGYSKNKIHCSCPMCSEKTNARQNQSRGPVSKVGYKRNGEIWWHVVGTRIPGTCKRLGKNWTASDRRKIEDQRDQLTEWRKAG